MRKLRKRVLLVSSLLFLLMLALMASSTLLVHTVGNGKSYSRALSGGQQIGKGDYPLIVPGFCITGHSVRLSYDISRSKYLARNNFSFCGLRYSRGQIATPLYVQIISLDFRPSIMVFGSLAALAYALGPVERRWRRKREGLCLQCGYDLRGCVSNICPECGLVPAK